jgi:pimeloyl-ACP methyl ester carboxylesterase
MKLVVQGLLTQYSDDGDREAPVALLLHGWGTSGQNFDGLSAQLAATHRVLRPDFPGFGGTERPGTDWQLQEYAEFVAAFLRKLEVAPPALILGHSFGGRVLIKALAAGLLYPRRAILLDSAGIARTATVRNQAFKFAAKAGKAATALPGLARLRSKLRRKLYESAGSTDYLNSGQLRQIFLNTINEDLKSAAARISVPTLLIWGASDTDTPPADGRLLSQIIPHATFHVIPGAGHFAHIDAPQRVYQLIDEFIQ